MSNQAESKLWSTRIMYALCSCTDNKHDQTRIYNTYEQIRDAQAEAQDYEHVLRVKQETRLAVIAEEAT